MKRLIIFSAAVALLGALALDAAPRPPKPGDNFVWIDAHRTPKGEMIHGHWRYTGPDLDDREWVYGHYNAKGIWVEGHWRDFRKPHPGPKAKNWVPAHRAPNGHWVKGHWR